MKLRSSPKTSRFENVGLFHKLRNKSSDTPKTRGKALPEQTTAGRGQRVSQKPVP